MVSKEESVPAVRLCQVAPTEVVASVSPRLLVPLPASKLSVSFQGLKLEISGSREPMV